GNIFTDNNLYMNGPEVFNFTTNVVPNLATQVLALNDMLSHQVDQFILHQANAFMLEFLRKRLKIDRSRFFIDLRDGGNTVSCTIPIALKKYSGNISENEKIILLGFGVGLSWCGGLVEIDTIL